MTNYELMNAVRDGLELEAIETIKWHATLKIKLMVTKVEDREGNLIEKLEKPKAVEFPFSDAWQVGKNVKQERAKEVAVGLIYHKLDAILKVGYFDYSLMRYYVRGFCK